MAGRLRDWFGRDGRDLAGYCVALLGTVLATAARYALDPILGDTAQYVTFYLSAMLAAVIGGLRPGLLATAMGALLGLWFFAVPRGQLVLHGDDIVLVLGFLAAGVGTSFMAARLHMLRHRAERQARTLQQHNAELDAERARWLAVIEGIADEVWICDAQGRMSLMNLPAVTQMGLAEFRDKSVQQVLEEVEILNPDGQPRPVQEAPLLRSLGGQIIHGEEIMHHRRTGKQCWRQFSSAPIRSTSGQITGSVAIVRDITDLRQAEEALRESAQRLRATFDNAAVGIVEVDVPGRFVAVNDHVCHILGYCREQLLGMTVHELTAPEDRPVSDQLNAELREGRRERLDYEKRYLRQDGSVLWAHVTVSTVRDSAGRPLRYIGTIEDISERKQAAQQLQELNAELEQRVAQRTAEAEQRAQQLRLLATELTQTEQKERRRLAQVLHDHLQQLLVGARVNIGIVRSQGSKEEGERALQQVDGLLEESLQITRSLTAQLSPSVLHMGSFADALRWLGRSMRDRHGLVVEIEAGPGIDPQAEDVRVLLFEATRELLFNVVKHAKVEHATVRMELAGKELVRVVVADEGCGLDPVACAQPKPSGSGFGLFSIRERLQLLGGRLEIDSTAGRGTRVMLVVPVAGSAEMAVRSADEVATLTEQPGIRP